MYRFQESQFRSLVKGITWRIVGTIDTIAISFWITGSPIKAVSIGGVEVFTKIGLYYLHERGWEKVPHGIWEQLKKKFLSQIPNELFADNDWFMSREYRELKKNQQGMVLWMTGLSGSGKTTIARHIEKRLTEKGYVCQVLDGDVLRNGLNNDLSFSEEDRRENVRRTAEVSKLFAQSGIITIVSLISPSEDARQYAREIIGEADFNLIYVNATLDICEKRDVKGLYAKARKNEIKNFTGVSMDFQNPKQADLTLNTDIETVDESVKRVYEFLNIKVASNTKKTYNL